MLVRGLSMQIVWKSEKETEWREWEGKSERYYKQQTSSQFSSLLLLLSSVRPLEIVASIIFV